MTNPFTLSFGECVDGKKVAVKSPGVETFQNWLGVKSETIEMVVVNLSKPNFLFAKGPLF